MSILNEIATKTRRRVDELNSALSKSELERIAAQTKRPNDFISPFQGRGTNILAEIKFASPSEGDILNSHNATLIARDYLENGAKALSILTEPYYFKGDLQYLRSVRKEFPRAPLLMKDFIVDEYQLFLARANGADAVLILLAMLDPAHAAALYQRALALELTPLVEVHSAEEFQFAIELGAKLIGVNNRNLKTMEVSLKTSEQLAPLAPKQVTLLSESGISSAGQIAQLQSIGFNGFLIGTHFMKTGTPGKALAQILRALQ